MGRGSPPQGRLRDHDHSRAGEGGDTLDIGEVTADDVNLEDDDTLDFGTSDDVSMKFDPAVGANGAFVLRDERTGAAEDRLVIPLGAAMQLAGQNLDVNSQDLEDGAQTIYDAAAGEVLNAVVAGLANLGANDAFSAFPIEAADVNESSIAVTDFGIGTVSDGQAVGNSGGSLAGISVGGGRTEPLYGDGSDGSITRSGDANESGLIQATDYTVQQGVTMTVNTGVLVVMATDSIDIQGVLDATGQGASGPTSDGANGNAGHLFPTQAGGAGGSGGDGQDGGDGGGGDTGNPKINERIAAFTQHYVNDFFVNSRTIGASGGAGGAGRGNQGSVAEGNNGSAPGGGGEGGSTTDSTSDDAGGDGGAGGGLIVLIAPSITVAGTVQAAGVDGTDGSGPNPGGGGGGGGSGGLVWLVTASLSENTPTYDVSKGLGGAGATVFNAGGGDGADGEDGVVLKVTG